MKKAVFFDIDGTLIDASKGMVHLSDKVRVALNALKQSGNYIFIASGRPLDFLDPELVNFGFNGFLLMNGAVVIIDNEVVFAEPIDKSIINDIVATCEKFKIEYILQSHPKVYLKNNFKRMENFYISFKIDVNRFVREFNPTDLQVYKMEFQTADARTDIATLYKKWLNSPELTGIVDPFHRNNMELYSRKNSKGSGILHALEHLGIDIKDSYAFGDGLNDLEMIQTVGCGMAMGSGNDKLKKLAKYVVPGVHEDGVAYGIYKHILRTAV